MKLTLDGVCWQDFEYLHFEKRESPVLENERDLLGDSPVDLLSACKGVVKSHVSYDAPK